MRTDLRGPALAGVACTCAALALFTLRGEERAPMATTGQTSSSLGAAPTPPRHAVEPVQRRAVLEPLAPAASTPPPMAEADARAAMETESKPDAAAGASTLRVRVIGAGDGWTVRLDQPRGLAGAAAPVDALAPTGAREGRLERGEATLDGVPADLTYRLCITPDGGHDPIVVRDVRPRGQGGLASLDVDLQAKREREAAAMATLRSIAAAQQQLQASAAIDTDADGGGEFGYFGELAGTTPMRKYDGQGGQTLGGPSDVLSPAFLARKFGEVRSVGGVGTAEREGYFFQIHLPDAMSEGPIGGLAEAPNGGSLPQPPGASNAEVYWSCYAWPIEEHVPPLRAFFINQEGDVIACEGNDRTATPYLGERAVPRFDAALSATVPRDFGQALGLAVLGNKSNDGFHWVPVAR